MLQSLGEEREGKLQMLLSPRKNGLTSLFKEVRAFKVFSSAQVLCAKAPSLPTLGSFLLTIEILCLPLCLLTVGDLFFCYWSLVLTSEVFCPQWVCVCACVWAPKRTVSRKSLQRWVKSRKQTKTYRIAHTNVGLPQKQKIGVKTNWVEKVKFERNADNFGREFWEWFFFWGGGLKPWRNNSREQFAGRIRWENRQQFS